LASEHNRIRRKWQDYGGRNAGIAEASFYGSFASMFPGTDYIIRAKPKEFQNIYVNIPLTPEEQGQIYSPALAITRHGVVPDYAIENSKTGKTIYVEVKRQDGWIDGGKRSDGRGNAHERSCKFFTPGLLRRLREAGGIAEPALPFWVVFQGAITRDPCRVREINCWYEGVEDHFFFWRQAPDPDLLFKHFDERISPLLN
jgi:hypothetical protein